MGGDGQTHAVRKKRADEAMIAVHETRYSEAQEEVTGFVRLHILGRRRKQQEYTNYTHKEREGGRNNLTVAQRLIQ